MNPSTKQFQFTSPNGLTSVCVKSSKGMPSVRVTSSNGSTTVRVTSPIGSHQSLPAPSTKQTNVMPRATTSPILTPSPPFPPNWHEHYQDTIHSLRNFQLFPVDRHTAEYDAIAALLDPALISTVEQIVNPTLWTRFVNTRKDMLKSKCNDLEVLAKLDLSENELMTSYQHSVNFETDPAVLKVPYNDNMALLFHCTRDPNNVENILRQGLDERMGSAGGLLGKGIYFTDNPEKSMTYDGCGGIIFIFAVLLGDCLALDGIQYDFVREPEKYPEQKRNFNDLFFDSIVGQPGRGLDNEFVIYNRYQCCPLYMVKYSTKSYTPHANPNGREYVTSRKYFPPIGWTSLSKYKVTPTRVWKTWPFFAKTIFTKMETTKQQLDADISTAGGNLDENGKKKPTKKSVTKLDSFGLDFKLQRLSEMGFLDREENIKVLKKHGYQLDKSVSYLLQQETMEID